MADAHWHPMSTPEILHAGVCPAGGHVRWRGHIRCLVDGPAPIYWSPWRATCSMCSWWALRIQVPRGKRGWRRRCRPSMGCRWPRFPKPSRPRTCGRAKGWIKPRPRPWFATCSPSELSRSSGQRPPVARATRPRTAKCPMSRTCRMRRTLPFRSPRPCQPRP